MSVCDPQGSALLSLQIQWSPSFLPHHHPSWMCFSSSRLRSPPFVVLPPPPRGQYLQIQHPDHPHCLPLPCPPPSRPASGQPRILSARRPPFVCLSSPAPGDSHIFIPVYFQPCRSRLQMCYPQLGPTHWLISIFPGPSPC